MKNLIVTLLCITLISCTQEVLDKTEPLSIAKTILIAYKAKDLKTLSSFTYAQSENSAYKKLLSEMIEKGEDIYIAHKYDKLDQTLGNYLNSYPEKKR